MKAWLARKLGIRTPAARLYALDRALSDVDWAMRGTPWARYFIHVQDAKERLRDLRRLMTSWRE